MNKIMIVDDNTQFRSSLSEVMLETPGIIVSEAESGNDALKIVERERPDLIIMDILMPGMDGWEAAGEIRMIGGFENMPVIFCSGSYQDEMKFASSHPAGCAFITKPIDIEKLFDLIEGLLQGRDGAPDARSLPAAQNLR